MAGIIFEWQVVHNLASRGTILPYIEQVGRTMHTRVKHRIPKLAFTFLQNKNWETRAKFTFLVKRIAASFYWSFIEKIVLRNT